MEHSAKGLRKRALRSMDYPEKKVKQEPGNLIQSPLFGQPLSPTDVGSHAVRLTKSPLFGGKTEKTVILIGDLSVGAYASIVGRVSFIGDVTRWDNGRSQGKVLSIGVVNQLDEVSISCFNEKIDDCHHLLAINKVLEVSGFRVKVVEDKYQKIAGQGLEAILDFNGTVSASSEDVDQIRFNFKDIVEVHALTVRSLVDLVGIAYEADEMVEGTTVNGKDFAFRKLLFTDKTEMQYSLKIWGDQARALILEKPTVFALRRGKLESYESDKYININGSSLFWIHPPIPEASQLKDWLKSRLPKA